MLGAAFLNTDVPPVGGLFSRCFEKSLAQVTEVFMKANEFPFTDIALPKSEATASAGSGRGSWSGGSVKALLRW